MFRNISRFFMWLDKQCRYTRSEEKPQIFARMKDGTEVEIFDDPDDLELIPLSPGKAIIRARKK